MRHATWTLSLALVTSSAFAIDLPVLQKAATALGAGDLHSMNTRAADSTMHLGRHMKWTRLGRSSTPRHTRDW
jgi:hypothetical protein